MIGRTTITIAHRLAMIQKLTGFWCLKADRLSKAREHMKDCWKIPDSVYRRLYDIQALDLRPGYSWAGVTQRKKKTDGER